MTKLVFFALIFAAALSSTVGSARAQQSGTPAAAAPGEASHQPVTAMKIRIRLEDKVITATLADNPTSRDFVSLLPLTLTSTEGAPPGSDPAIGDIAYYAPWGNLALFYKDFRYSSGLIKLGKIDSGAEVINVADRLRVKIELVGKQQ